MPKETADKTRYPLEAFRLSELLKNVVRYKNAVDDVEKESVAEHSWRVAFMVMVVCEELSLKIDVLKAIKIAMVHDLIEAITDDIDSVLVRQGEVSSVDKQNDEIIAIANIESILGPNLGSEIRNLWEDFEFRKSKEALLVQALDKIEAMSHMTLVGLKSRARAALVRCLLILRPPDPGVVIRSRLWGRRPHGELETLGGRGLMLTPYLLDFTTPRLVTRWHAVLLDTHRVGLIGIYI